MIKLLFKAKAASPEQQQTREKLQTTLDTAFATPAKRHPSLPFADPAFFCPGVLQREFIVAEAGDKINGRKITHLATEYVSSCQVLLLHADGERPVTGVAHLDWNTKLLATIDTMLGEFTVKPTRAEIHSTAFNPMQPGIMSVMNYSPSQIRTLETNRNNNIVATTLILSERDIPVTTIDLSHTSTTFIADVNEGRIWNGEEPSGTIFHHRDVDSYLANFFMTGKDRKITTAISPYQQMIARNVITLPYNDLSPP